ncbi:RHS repeat protein [Alphaproteobacteria bacterium LMG 31809]|uniref:RHS repeat protein n=1 Tax=Govanella unica TaxID=2975056 RepID=A0A9X3U042_9PROT|nr:RHS repeat protein [Govania unica]
MAYDTAGNVTKVTDPRGTTAQTTYTSQYGWDSMRRLVQKTDANGKLYKYTYNLDGELTKTEAQVGAAWQTTSYSYTPTGQQATVTDASNQVTTKSYDALDRLSVVTDAAGRRSKVVYDSVGQVLKEIRAWAGSNDNCAVPGTLQQCYARSSYDQNGRKLAVQDANGNITSYLYDGHERLTKATFPDSRPMTPTAIC